MSYTALYRKFRPDHFDDVKGQDHIVTTLKNQIEAGRIGHAYLFCGTRGTGKTTIAKLFAKTVNCEDLRDGNPCGECRSCKAIAAGASMNVIEIDAASNNGVDNIREIVDEVSYSPAEGKYKVYIIDEVHMLSIGAFNALLKTLEEPPSYVIFILATTEAHKIPITILSRCQRYDFRRITIDTITDRLRELMQAEQTQVEEKALRYVAKAADGSMRDALSLLDQCIAFHFGRELTYDNVLDVLGAVDTQVFGKLLSCILDKRILDAVELLEEIVIQGRELTQFISDFTWYLRNLMLIKSSLEEGQDAALVEDVVDASAEAILQLQEEAKRIEINQIMRYIRIFSELSGQLRYASGKRILIEMTLIKICKPEMEKDYSSLRERVKELEAKLENGAFTAAPASRPEEPVHPKTERKKLDRAVPDEVKLLVTKWQGIVTGMENPMKMYLRAAGLSLGGDNRLMIVLEDGPASDYFLKSPDHKLQLEQILSNELEKQIEVSIQSLEAEKRFEDNYVDLTQIHMEIEEED